MDKKISSRLKSPCKKTKTKKKHISEGIKTDDQVIQPNLMDEYNSNEGMAIPLKQRKKKTSGFFIREIRSMMYGFGDCRCPLLESVEIVETIVRNEMCEMLLQAARNARLRKSNCISHEDVLFLLRKDKVKLRRLLKCLEVKDLRAEVDHKRPQDEGIKKRKRVQLCLTFLKNIAVANEYLDLMDDNKIDPIVLERRLRCAKNTERMTPDEYLEYSVARQATFANNKRGNGRFKDWLLIINPTGMEPTDFACEIFNYFAHETVAQIVDLALLVRRDSETDPFDRLRPNTINISDASVFKEDGLKTKSPVKPPNENESFSIDSPVSQHTISPAAQHFTDSPLEQPTSTLQRQSQTSISKHTIASIMQEQFPTSNLQKYNNTSPHQHQYTVSPQHNMDSPPLQEASSSTAQWLNSPQTELSSASRIMTSTKEHLTEETTLLEKRRKLLEKRRRFLKRKRKVPKYEGEYSPFDPITPKEIKEVMRRYSQPIGPFYVFSRVYHKKIIKHLLCC